VSPLAASLLGFALSFAGCSFEKTPIIPRDWNAPDNPPSGGGGSPVPNPPTPMPDAATDRDAQSPPDAMVEMDARVADAGDAAMDSATPEPDATLEPEATADTGAPDTGGPDEDATVCDPDPGCLCPHLEPLTPRTDPCAPPLCTAAACAPDDSCSFVYHADHAYYFCREGQTWEEARDHCLEIGFTLASIESKAEDDMIFEHIDAKAWLGGHDGSGPEEGVWRWSDETVFYRAGMGGPGGPGGGPGNEGEAFGYVNWHETEPNNDGLSDDSPADCLLFWYENGVWADGSCDDENGYVCEVARPLQ
jgi:hypothetical protein